jgi:GntR family transcriptional regulator
MTMTTANRIDFDSHIPYYIQLKEIIRARIKDGTWTVGDRLPSEAEFCTMFDVSRPVVRQALQDLIHEGLIRRRKGKGSFVASNKIIEQLAQKLTGFYQDMVEQGLQPVTTVLAQHIIPATAEIAEQLRIAVDEPVIEIVRLRAVQQVPVVLVTTYLPYSLCPKLVREDLNNQSLYELLENRYGIQIVRGRRAIHAVLAEGQEAKLLEVNKGAPLFRLESTCFLENGTPVEYYIAFHRGDRTQFDVELIRTRRSGDYLSMDEELPPSNHVYRQPIR